MREWIRAARPKTFVISIAPVLLGASVAIHYCRFSIFLFLCTLLAALSIQIGSHFANDYYDFLKGADTHRNGRAPTKALIKGTISLAQMGYATILCFLVATLLTLPLIIAGGSLLIYTLIFSIAFALLYTASPYALAYTGTAPIVAFCFYGPIPTLITTYLMTGFFSMFAFLVGLAPGALSAAILTAADLRDTETDRAANKMTFPARFGETAAKWLYAALLIFAALVPYLVFHHMWLRYRFLFALYMIFPAIALIRKIFTLNTPEQYAKMLPLTVQFLLFDTILLGLACLT